MSDSSSSSSAQSETKLPPLDEIFAFNQEEVDQLYTQATRTRDEPKAFKRCRVSALAAMKMLRHALAGVDKGRASGTNPVEVMGLLIGKPQGDAIVVFDCVELPVEGIETSVVADTVTERFMVSYQTALEKRRKETLVGWYHSHPFDLGSHNHCFFSNTDVQTHTVWQAGMPVWCGIVVDPLRSLSRQEPEFGCFRTYPVAYTPPAKISPDGSYTDDKYRMSRWGAFHHRYYELPISFFMSSTGKQVLDIMSRKSLWIRVLSSAPFMETENRERYVEKVRKVVDKLDNAQVNVGSRAPHIAGPRDVGSGSKALSQASGECCELAFEQVKSHMLQISKDVLFNSTHTAQAPHDHQHHHGAQEEKKDGGA